MLVETWIIAGLTGAIIVALFNIYQKYIIDDGISPLIIALQMHIVGSIIMVFIMSFVPYEESIGNFWTYEIYSTINIYIPRLPNMYLFSLLIATGVVNAVSFLLLASAYTHDALSIIAPLRGITPIIVAILEPLFFDLSYQIELILASLVVATGIYIVLYEGDRYEPIRRIKDLGVLKGLASAGVIAIAVLIDRYALVNYEVDPVNYTGGLIISTMVFTFVIIALMKGKKSLQTLIIKREMMVLGFLRTGAVGFAIVALSLIEGTRVNVIWQTNIIIVALFGGKLLKEDNIIRRSFGAALILVATIIVVVT